MILGADTMNIALAGAHGVGKTTLGRKLFLYYSSERKTFFSTGIPRKIISNGYPLGYAATTASYIEYIIEQLSSLRDAYNYELYISDRSLLDAYAYALSNYRVGKSLISRREVELLQRVWEFEQKEYNLYLYIPIQFQMEVDGVRPIGENYREVVSQTTLELIEHYGLRHEIISGDREEIMMKAITAIEKLY